MIFESGFDFVQAFSEKVKHGIMGIDYGKLKLGIAVAHSDSKISTPIAIIARKNLCYDIDVIKDLVKDYKINGLVLGMPMTTDGQEASVGKQIRKFAAKLVQELELPITFQDESFSTETANEMLKEMGIKRKKRNTIDDGIASKIILDRFMQMYW